MRDLDVRGLHGNEGQALERRDRKKVNQNFERCRRHIIEQGQCREVHTAKRAMAKKGLTGNH
jgi:hypothetical protein